MKEPSAADKAVARWDKMSFSETHFKAQRLREIRHEHAAEVARMARLMQLAGKKLMKLHKRMHAQAARAAGDDFFWLHQIAFLPLKTLPKKEGDSDDAAAAPGLREIIDLMGEVSREAEECAEHVCPPPLPSEY